MLRSKKKVHNLISPEVKLKKQAIESFKSKPQLHTSLKKKNIESAKFISYNPPLVVKWRAKKGTNRKNSICQSDPHAATKKQNTLIYKIIPGQNSCHTYEKHTQTVHKTQANQNTNSTNQGTPKPNP
jgi:hypothetical protein